MRCLKCDHINQWLHIKLLSLYIIQSLISNEASTKASGTLVRKHWPSDYELFWENLGNRLSFVDFFSFHRIGNVLSERYGSELEALWPVVLFEATTTTATTTATTTKHNFWFMFWNTCKEAYFSRYTHAYTLYTHTSHTHISTHTSTHTHTL